MNNNSSHINQNEHSGDGPYGVAPEVQRQLVKELATAVSEAVEDAKLQDKQLLTARDVATYLNLSLRTIETLIAEGQITPIRIRGSRRFAPEAIEKFLSSCKSNSMFQQDAGEGSENE